MTSEENNNPSHLGLILQKASTYFSQEDWTGALRYLEQAASLAPQHAQLHGAIGIAAFKLKDYPAACSAYESALKISPNNPDLLIQYATALSKLKRIKEAAQSLSHALRLKPDDATALGLLASLEESPDRQPAFPTVPPNPLAGRTGTAHGIALDAGLSLEIGDYSYIHDNRLRNPSGAITHVSIGRFCSIATDLTIIGYDHRTDWITTYPFLDAWHRERWPGTQSIPSPSAPEYGGNLNRGDVHIGNDVWIGYNVKIFKGVSIGDGAVIGACSMVNKNVPPYAIVGGIPARRIRMRFPDEHIDFLQSIKWWLWPIEKINRYLPFLCSAHIDDLGKELTGDQVDHVNRFADTPKTHSFVPAASDADRRYAQAGIQQFIDRGRAFFHDVAPPRLAESHLVNSRLLPSRHHILPLMPKGGICAEVGTQGGRFAKRILAEIRPSKFHIFDIDFTPFDRPSFEEAIARGVVELHQGDSSSSLAGFPDRYFDFIYIDGDHSYEGVVRDLAQAVLKTKPDGWIVCNDYAVFSPLEKMKYGVMRAVNEFCLRHDYEIRYLGLHQWGYHDVALRKRQQ